MIAKLVDVFFGCRHSRYSFPVTVRGAARRPQAAALTGVKKRDYSELQNAFPMLISRVVHNR